MRIYRAILLSGLAGVLVGAVVMYTLQGQAFRANTLTTHLSSAEPMPDHDDLAPVRSLDEPTKTQDSYLQVRTLWDVSRLKSDFDQELSLRLLLARADEGDLNEYIHQSNALISINQRVAFLAVIFQRYAAIDPHKAIERALEIDQLREVESVEILYSIFNEWAVADLNGAVAAIHELPQVAKEIGADAMMQRIDHLSPDERIELVQAIGPTDDSSGEKIAEIRSKSLTDDPRKAYYDLIRDRAGNQELDSNLTDAAKYWVESDGVEVLAEIYDSIENLRMRRRVLYSVIWSSVVNNKAMPTSVLQEISKFPVTQEANYLAQAVFGAWSRLDPKESFVASLEQDDRLISDRSRLNLLYAWANEDPEGVYEEALTLPRRFQAAAIVDALSQISKKSPQEAIQLALKLDTRALRTSARDAIVRGWRSSDAKSAFEWLMNHGLEVQARRDMSLWRTTFSMFLEEDFAAARTYVEQYEGAFRDLLIETTVVHLIDLDLTQAVAHMKNLDSDVSEWFLHSTANSLARLNPMEALSYGETLDPHRQNDYYESVVYSWVDEDSASLYENIHRIPSKHRSLAATLLLHLNGRSYYLSDEEVDNLEPMFDSSKAPVRFY